MTHSESLASLATALVAAQAEIENVAKNAQNPHFRSKYADLAEIINEVRPTLTKHGLSVVQFPGFEQGVVTVETMLLHKSGEWIRGVAGAPATKQDAQGVGSAVTYLRRYSLAAVCAIAQEDDDGNAASSGKPRHREEKGGDIVDTHTGEVVAEGKPAAAAADRKALERWVSQFADVTMMEPADKRTLTVAARLVDDENAKTQHVTDGIARLKALLNKYKPLSPVEAEIREQEIELANV